MSVVGLSVIAPASGTAIPIRQYGKFQALETGVNTARFYRITVPDAGAIETKM